MVTAPIWRVESPTTFHDVDVLYGLAGDPPHRGHAASMQWLLARAARVHVTLSAAHAFGKAMAPWAVRQNWLQQLVDEHSDLRYAMCESRLLLSDVEARLQRERPEQAVYSIETMLALQNDFPGRTWVWAFGQDNTDPAVLNRFHRASDVAQWAVWALPECPHVRSTLIRHELERQPKSRAALEQALGPGLASSVMAWAETAKGHAWLAARRGADLRNASMSSNLGRSRHGP